MNDRATTYTKRRCTARLAGGPLVCTRDEHGDRGHVYESTSGMPERVGGGEE